MRDRKGRRATILDVADAAGISHATVSRYLNKRSYVSADARRSIEAAIKEVNYVPNRTARSLVSQKTHSAAFIVREHSDLFFADPNLSSMAIGANATLSQAGYQMPLLIVESAASAARVTELIAGGSVDGAILVAMLNDDTLAQDLARSDTPLVTASSPLTDSPIPSVDTENTAATQKITELLIGTGRRVLAEILGPLGAPVSALRDQGYRAGAGPLYRPDLVVSAAEWTAAAGAAAMHELLRLEPGIDGVVAASDALAAGAIEALQHAGRRVPEDVGVVGFDDAPIAVQVRPPLSTVRQDARLTGVRMAELLLRQIEGEDLTGHRETIPNSVIWRDSAGLNPAAATGGTSLPRQQSPHETNH